MHRGFHQRVHEHDNRRGIDILLENNLLQACLCLVVAGVQFGCLLNLFNPVITVNGGENVGTGCEEGPHTAFADDRGHVPASGIHRIVHGHEQCAPVLRVKGEGKDNEISEDVCRNQAADILGHLMLVQSNGGDPRYGGKRFQHLLLADHAALQQQFPDRAAIFGLLLAHRVRLLGADHAVLEQIFQKLFLHGSSESFP